MILCNCLYCDNCQNHVQVLTTESIFSESAPQIKALVRSPSAFSTLFAPGKSRDNVGSTTAPYTESRLTRSVANERVGFPVVEQYCRQKSQNVSLEIFLHRQASIPARKLSTQRTKHRKVHAKLSFIESYDGPPTSIYLNIYSPRSVTLISTIIIV